MALSILASILVILFSLIMLFVDWRQTREIFRRPSLHEVNSVIRWCYRRWGQRGLCYYFGVCALVVVAVWGRPNVSETIQTFRIIGTTIWWFQQVGWIISNRKLLK